MDGRTTASKGSTLRELAEDMLSMGCTTVVNMDGGGSSTLALRMPGKEGFTILNKPRTAPCAPSAPTSSS